MDGVCARRRRISTVGSCVLVLLASLGAYAQDPVPPADAPQAAPSGVPLPASAAGPGEGNHPTAPVPMGFHQFKLDTTFLPGGHDGLGILDLELTSDFRFPFADGWAPVVLTPYAAAHWWDGPASDRLPTGVDLPDNLYDFSLDVGWKPRLARWLFADVGVTPGLYSDLRDVNADAFQLRGRGLAIVAFSESLQAVAGALYVNRNKTKVLPAGGVIWQPDEDTKLTLVFPAPKIAYRFASEGEAAWWGYVAGEFGGGRWSVERANGQSDLLDYTDVRALAGVERVCPHGLSGHLECGYVFGRRVNFASTTPDYKPRDTVMVRAGLAF